MKKNELAKCIIQMVGGEENIISLTHCVTRLRFILKEQSKADLNGLKNINGVITAQLQGEETQVVIGPKVKELYDEVAGMIHITVGDKIPETNAKKENIVNSIITSIAGIFVPLLPVLVGCGMFKALVTIITNLHWLPADSSMITVLNMIGDLIFYFFPFFLASSAAKKFKTNESLAIALAAGLMYPTIMNGALAVADGGPSALSFLGMPMLYINYKSTVIPIILAVFVLKYVYKYVDKVVPDLLKTFLTPMLVLIIMIPLELIVIGPMGTYAGDYIAIFINWLYSIGGIMTAAIVAGTRGLLTMLGMHYALGPLTLQQLAATGTTSLLVGAFANNFAQSGAAFGTALKIKDRGKRSAALGTAFSAMLGITEPAMYGINLVYKRPFAFAMIGAAVSGVVLELFHTVALAYVPPGLFTVVTLKADSYIGIVLGLAVAFLVAAILSYLFAFEKEENVSLKSEEEMIYSPVKGNIVEASVINDETFSSEAMGTTVGIQPVEGKVYAPFDGTVSMLFPTKHAIGLTSTKGTEILIHIGLNTVKEDGNGFQAFVKEGDSFKKGDLLMEFDLEELAKKYDMTTPVIVTGSDAKEMKKCLGSNKTIADAVLMLER